jgi:hypothetical protein
VDYANFQGDSGAPVVVVIDNEPIVIGLVIATQRLTSKVATPFEERTVHVSLGLAAVIQSPFILQTIAEWRKSTAKTDSTR